MDVDIKNEFTAVRADLQTVREDLQTVRTDLQTVRTDVQTVRTDLQSVDTRVSAEIRLVETTLRQEIREEGIATRRHFDVVAESLRDDIRIIAEGLIALDTKVETMRDSG
jgi:uncharacterized protein (DUF3084 family)